jgi:PAS domain S-box-containing protein
LVGFEASELVGRGPPRLYRHPDGDAMLHNARTRVLGDRNAPAHFELLLRHRDGHAINVVCYVSPLMTGEEMTGWLTVYYDITERKRVERTLHESEARFRSAFHESASGMSLVAPSGRWVMVNRTVCEITGYSEPELLAMTFQDITYPPDLNKDLDYAHKLLAGEIQTYRIDKRYIHKTGRLVWIDLTVSLVRDEQNQPLYFCSQFQDITARKETAAQLLAAKEAAEAANQAKSAFLANMSHEIRTPLNAIAGFAEALEGGDLAASERHEFAQTIRRNSDHLLGILSDILDVSKIEAGKMSIESLPVHPREVIEDVCAMLRGKADAKGLELRCDIAAAVPARLVTDPTRLRQILLNLIGNAIKFTDSGSISLRATLENEQTLQIDVIDTGHGIPQPMQAEIFEPFTQVDVSHSRKFGGTGLGLAISRRLAVLLGGDIRLQSSSERGSVFSLRLPNRSPVEGQSTAAANVPSAIRPGRVLVVEDSHDSQRLLQFLLQRLKFDVTLAENGERAITAVGNAAAQGKPFELIIMDMQMPVLDGYTATPMLRRGGCNVPIVALTANAMPQDRRHCLDVGCDDFLTKPVQAAALHEILRHYFEV